MALRRHQCLQRRMERDPVLRENISRQIREYVEKGYAHRETAADLENADPKKVWFLPLGAVTNPIKPKEHIQQYPRAVEGILKSHYVDDYLDSFGSENEAEKISMKVRLVHHNGEFHLRNWRSNSKRTKLDESANVDSKNLYPEPGEPVDRILGMLWSSSADELSFSTCMSEEVRNLLDSDSRPTYGQRARRESTYLTSRRTKKLFNSMASFGTS